MARLLHLGKKNDVIIVDTESQGRPLANHKTSENTFYVRDVKKKRKKKLKIFQKLRFAMIISSFFGGRGVEILVF